MARKKDENKDIRSFSLALAVLLGGFAALGWYREREFWPYLAAAAVVVLVVGLFLKPLMRPVFRGWMWLAMKLNWVVTRILLTSVWLVMFVPVGLVLRALRIDFFDRKIEPQKESYWHERPDVPYDRNRTERMG
ncbi:MAG: SxtJ family membrane protein [Candidatus Lernaella stagnicola]|nr:SxtJ family membrane protein [Candidatus Lernaella stagnicola]